MRLSSMCKLMMLVQIQDLHQKNASKSALHFRQSQHLAVNLRQSCFMLCVCQVPSTEMTHSLA